MNIYAYKRTFFNPKAEEESRIDYSENIEELIVHYRRERNHSYFKDFVFLGGKLEPIAEFTLKDI
jgi:hypothetical protein